MATISTGIPGVVIHKEQWTQCENDNCQKWRKLPPGTLFDDAAPWYCYMNPDSKHNRCSASEESYDEKTEIVLDAHLDDEEAVHNQLIKRHLEASIAAEASLSAMHRGRGRGRSRGSGRRGRGRGRGGRKIVAQEDSDSEAHVPSSVQAKRLGLPEATSAPSSKSPSNNLGQNIAHCLQALEHKGSWVKDSVALSEPLPSMPAAAPLHYAAPCAAAWEALNDQAPALADVACEAADLATSAKYFQDEPSGDAALQETSLVARMALMLNASSALVMAEHALTTDERTRAGLSEAFEDVNPPNSAAGMQTLGSQAAKAIFLQGSLPEPAGNSAEAVPFSAPSHAKCFESGLQQDVAAS